MIAVVFQFEGLYSLGHAFPISTESPTTVDFFCVQVREKSRVEEVVHVDNVTFVDNFPSQILDNYSPKFFFCSSTINFPCVDLRFMTIPVLV